MSGNNPSPGGSSGRPPSPGLDPGSLSEEDILAAMKQISGYLDITPGDLREIYSLAYAHARRRILFLPAREIMTRKVHYVFEDMPILEVARLLARTGVAGIPVLNRDRQVTGVISEKDFFRRMSRKEQTYMGLVAACMSSRACPALNIKGKVAADIMSSPAAAVEPDTPLHAIFDLMREKGINRVPVTEGRRLAGIVSRDDVLRAMSSAGTESNAD